MLEAIRAAAEPKSEVGRMRVEEYARALVEDAPYFVPERLLRAMEQLDYASEFDRALNYLSVMTTSGIRILAAGRETA